MNQDFHIDLNAFGLDEETRAYELFDQGYKISEVAVVIGISEIEAARFKKNWKEYNNMVEDLF